MSDTTFRKELWKSFFLFALIPVLLLGVLGGALVYFANEKTIKEQHNTLLSTINVQLESFYYRLHDDLRAIRVEIEADGEEAARESKSLFPEISSVMLLDDQGKMIRSFDSNRSADFYLLPALKRAMSQGAREFLSDAYYDPGLRRVVLAYLLRHKGKNYFFRLDPERLFKYIRRIKIQPEQSIQIVNRSGFWIFDTRHPERVSSDRRFTETGAYAIAVEKVPPYTLTEFPAHYRKGDSFFTGIFDDDHFLSYVRQKDWGWLIIVEDYTDLLDPYLNRILLFLLPFFLLLIPIVYWVVRRVTDRIMNPVEMLIQRIREATQGRVSRRVEVDDSSYPVCRELAESFNEMQERIRQREEALERSNQELNRKVEERTRSLRELNEKLEERVREEVTRNLQVQSRLARAEKLAAMGEMIANIAHQWRQPLSVISTLATGVKVERRAGVLEEEELDRVCEQINLNTQYLSRTIDDFRSFIKGDKEKSRFNFAEMIESLRHLIQSQLESYRIVLKSDVDPELEILGYRNDLIQILINLFNNAKDAIASTRGQGGWVRIGAEKEGKTLRLTIEDNGGGIPDEIIGRIFEPYFSTKDKSQGTGLGLHMVYRLVESMGGTITVENFRRQGAEGEERGARFVLEIPAEEMGGE